MANPTPLEKFRVEAQDVLQVSVKDPTRRGLRKVTVTAGRAFALLLLLTCLMFAAGGAVLTLLGSGFVDILGVFAFSVAAMTGAGGGAMMYGLGRFESGAQEGEIRRELRSRIARSGTTSDAEVAATLGISVQAVQEVAGDLARAGELVRDVDLNRGGERYEASGTHGGTSDLDRFDQQLTDASASAAMPSPGTHSHTGNTDFAAAKARARSAESVEVVSQEVEQSER